MLKKKPARTKRAASRKASPKAKPTSALVVLVLDESGSMEPFQNDVIGGTNAYVEGLGDKPDLAVIKFHSTVHPPEVYVPASKMPKVTAEWYKPQAMTALFDAVGVAIATGDNWLQVNRGGRVIVTIYTDGNENNSVRLTVKQLNEMVKDRTAKGWEFIYLGAHADAWNQAQSIGTVSAATYHYGAGDTRTVMQAAGRIVGQSVNSNRSATMSMYSDPAMAAAGATLAAPTEKKKKTTK